jgi:hypothetical protein
MGADKTACGIVLRAKLWSSHSRDCGQGLWCDLAGVKNSGAQQQNQLSERA